MYSRINVLYVVYAKHFITPYNQFISCVSLYFKNLSIHFVTLSREGSVTLMHRLKLFEEKKNVTFYRVENKSKALRNCSYIVLLYPHKHKNNRKKKHLPKYIQTLSVIKFNEINLLE